MDNEQPLYDCPCCGQCTLTERGHYDICGHCGWEDDPVQEELPDRGGGANVVSLNEARRNYIASGMRAPSNPF
jgi:hypothetical protein